MGTADQPRRIRMLRVVSAVLLMAGCGGCIFHDRCVHDPPLARNVPKIVRGQTTRAQILQYFGVPDLEAHGSTVTLHDDSVMGKERQKLKQLLESAQMTTEQYNTDGERRTVSGTDLFDEMARLWAYSSIDEDHVAYLYWETESRGGGWIIPLPIMIVSVDARWLRNKLLVLINEHTGVVDEFGFRQEFNTR